MCLISLLTLAGCPDGSVAVAKEQRDSTEGTQEQMEASRSWGKAEWGWKRAR